MRKSITPNQIKENNRRLIYQYIRNNPHISLQDISYHLQLSRPTVTAKLAELEEIGLIEKDGQVESDQVGRKAAAYVINANFRISIGVELTERECKIVIVNLYGEYTCRRVYPLKYENTEHYFQAVCTAVTDLTAELNIPDEQVLGVGITVQGLVSPDGTYVTYGKILDCTDLSIKVFSDHLPYPCRFFHDSAGAATSELWASPELKDAVYLMLGLHLGSAAIVDRQIIPGKHGHNSTIEHLPLDPNGKKCYCGQVGCAETVCSIPALMKPDDDIDEFFEKVRNGKHKAAAKKWETFLTYLARLIGNLHLVNDTDYILGGYLAPYFTEEDIEKMYEIIRQKTPFEEETDFIRVSKMPKHNITIGAALPYIRSFLNREED